MTASAATIKKEKEKKKKKTGTDRDLYAVQRLLPDQTIPNLCRFHTAGAEVMQLGTTLATQERVLK